MQVCWLVSVIAGAYIAAMEMHVHPLRFEKMHGAGNDFVLIDSRARDGGVMSAPLARAIGDRNRGVGFDQLVELGKSDSADVDLEFWNRDGSRAGACGNATRCVAARLMDETGRDTIRLRTARGILTARRDDARIWVNMGPPVLTWQDIPLAQAVDPHHLPLPGVPMAVGMGNPHCVVFVEDAETIPLATLGPELEHDPLFPQATNVEFVSLLRENTLRLRVWERGTGITLACGSGACATAVAANLRGLTDRCVAIEADGGQLEVDWRDDGVWLSGPVMHVFSASLSAEFLADAQ